MARLRRENKQLRLERDMLSSSGLVRPRDRHDPVRLFGLIEMMRTGEIAISRGRGET